MSLLELVHNAARQLYMFNISIMLINPRHEGYGSRLFVRSVTHTTESSAHFFTPRRLSR